VALGSQSFQGESTALKEACVQSPSIRKTGGPRMCQTENGTGTRTGTSRESKKMRGLYNALKCIIYQ
jgi:hypothetical protein